MTGALGLGGGGEAPVLGPLEDLHQPVVALSLALAGGDELLLQDCGGGLLLGRLLLDEVLDPSRRGGWVGGRWRGGRCVGAGGRSLLVGKLVVCLALQLRFRLIAGGWLGFSLGPICGGGRGLWLAILGGHNLGGLDLSGRVVRTAEKVVDGLGVFGAGWAFHFLCGHQGIPCCDAASAVSRDDWVSGSPGCALLVGSAPIPADEAVSCVDCGWAFGSAALTAP